MFSLYVYVQPVIFIKANQNMSILLIGGLENSKACEQFT